MSFSIKSRARVRSNLRAARKARDENMPVKRADFSNCIFDFNSLKIKISLLRFLSRSIEISEEIRIVRKRYPSGVPVLEQYRSDVGSRHSSVGTTSVSDTGSVSDECRNVRPIRYWNPTSFRHRIPTSFRYWILTLFRYWFPTWFRYWMRISFRYWIPTSFRYWLPTSFRYWIRISFHYQRTTLIWYRNFKYNKYKQ